MGGSATNQESVVTSICNRWVSKSQLLALVLQGHDVMATVEVLGSHHGLLVFFFVSALPRPAE